MRRYIVPFICCTLLSAAPLYGGSLSDMPQTKDYGEAKSLSYLQRAYFSLEQALFYTEKSRSARSLASFDYGRLLNDLELVEKDLHAYLYPRNEKMTGDFIPFKIEGEHFHSAIGSCLGRLMEKVSEEWESVTKEIFPGILEKIKKMLATLFPVKSLWEKAGEFICRILRKTPLFPKG